MKRYLWVSFLLFLFMPTSSVFACSGGYNFFPLRDIAQFDYFVKATVLEVDDVSHNAILRVERYFKGVGTSYIAIVRFTTGFHAVDNRGYDKGCNHGHARPLFHVGDYGYYGFFSNEDGTYLDSQDVAPDYLIENGHIQYYSYDGHAIIEDTTVAEFEAEVERILGQTTEFIPNSYDNQQEYPLLRPLHLTTESGRRYVMEIDRHIREIDLSSEAFAVSPDGAHVAYYLDASTITFGYCTRPNCYLEEILQQYYYHVPNPRDVPRVSAQNVEFSPNSNYVAAWNEASLKLYLFDNQTATNHGRQMNIVLLGNVDFQGELNTQSRLVVWSGDSSTLVFMDDAGIWRWHIYTMAEPELFLPTNGIHSEQIQFLELSQSGRYLRYGNGYDWQLMDMITNESFGNAIVTPDESNFIYVNSTLHDSSPQWKDCRPPFHQTCPFAISQNGELINIEWWQDNRVIFNFCDTQKHDCSSFSLVWALDNADLGYGSWNWGWVENIARSSYGMKSLLAIQRSDYELEIWYDGLNRIELYHPEIYVLSAQLDSPIVHIEWGQPIFYEERS